MSTNPYRGSAERWGGRFYIHYHQENIGKANNRNFNSASIISHFNKQKENALAASKETYKTLYRENVLSGPSLEIIDAIFEGGDGMITKADEQMRKNLEEALDFNKLQSLMQLQREANKISNSFAKAFSKTDRLQSFNTLLSILEKASDLLDSEEGNKLAIALSELNNNLKNKYSTTGATRVTLGIELQKALQNFIKKNEGSTFSQQQVSNAVSSMNNLAKLLRTGKTGKGKYITERNVTSLVDGIFNTGFAEGLIAIMDNTAKMSVDKAITSLTGRNTVASQTFNTVTQKFESSGNERLAAGKVDLKMENVSFEISYGSDEQVGQVTLTLGLSNKFYRENHFGGLDNKFKSQTYSAGSSGITLGNAIKGIFQGDDFGNYLGYNVIAHRTSRSSEAQALQDIILTRYITKLFSSRGGVEDFSQFMIVNGSVLSIWEIILATENFVGKSASVNKKSAPVEISFNSKEIENAAALEDAFLRIRETNSLINSTVFTAHVHFDKIKAARAKRS